MNTKENLVSQKLNNSTDINMRNVYQRIDDFIGTDSKELFKCYELHDLLQKEKEDIETKISIIRDEVPAKINEAIEKVDEMKPFILNFVEELKAVLEVYETDDLENSFEKLTVFSQKKKEYDKCLDYLRTLKYVEMMNCDIKKFYSAGDWSQCVSLYFLLCSLLHHIFNSDYLELVNYLKNIVQYWHNLLKAKLIGEYEQLLKALNWPLIARDKVLPAFPGDESKLKFQRLIKLLLDVELPEELRTKTTITSTLTIDFPTPSLPVFFLLEPLRKRYQYHFCGAKETNRPDKPEWMFTQILTWIKDHEAFLLEWMQPVYDEFSCSEVKVEFMRGLVKMVTEKLHSDLTQLQYDDSLFTHTLNETLGFHRELAEHYDYPSSCASVLSVLTQAQIFFKWIHTERKCAERRMDDMLNSETAWNVIAEDDKCKVTECGDKFIILLSTITSRYSALPQPGHRLQFLDFQLDLIDDFRLRLAQLKRDDFLDILDSDLPGILNTVHYLITVLDEWGTNSHFLMLHHFKEQLNTTEEGKSTVSVFDDILSLMNHFSDELTKEICTSVALEISAKCRPYRKDRWNIMPPMDPDTELGLTLTGCAMFQVVTTKLHQMQNVIAPEVFKNCWRFIADHLCKLIINDVILVNMFSKGGAQQIQFDVKRNILPLFAQFTSKPEAYFKPLLQACDLLCSDVAVNAETAPFHISALTKHQVESILNRKMGVGRSMLADLS